MRNNRERLEWVLNKQKLAKECLELGRLPERSVEAHEFIKEVVQLTIDRLTAIAALPTEKWVEELNALGRELANQPGPKYTLGQVLSMRTELRYILTGYMGHDLREVNYCAD